MSNLTAIVGSALTAVLALPLLAVAGLGGADSSCAPAPAGPTRLPTAQATPAGAWDTEQRAHARTIVTIGQTRGVPPWGWVVAVATAMQESSLRNLPGGDRDSIGLFQQRPSQGWGTSTQLADPAYQTQRFYQALQAVPNWQQRPLTVAAQSVQRSAHPDAYARWSDEALTLVTQTAAELGVTPPSDLQQAAAAPCPGGFGVVGGDGDGLPMAAEAGLPTGFALPAGTSPTVAIALMWALAQRGTPYSYGGDCTAPHDGDPAYQCDCSSLVQIAYRHAGIDLPRTTLDQIHSGIPVPDVGDVQPGDLVFIPGGNGTLIQPRHVGLYLGSGLVVHAPKTGDHVKIAHLGGWRPIAAVRRVVTH